ncbi:hypothetical protein [Nitrosomonas marina]|uniref:Uncharacterized protein n=1 Tax=Nitrosomonas marina TaxID=917 RepID=A0A1H8IZ56_9PROT|nr:hypothetical protein [Nitrosomonas marina]SEN73207.1 hypothetical protein SAMN05216325_1447 [Nitrosomonas marina]
MSQRWNVDNPQIVEILSDFSVPGHHPELYVVHTSNLPVLVDRLKDQIRADIEAEYMGRNQ